MVPFLPEPRRPAPGSALPPTPTPRAGTFGAVRPAERTEVLDGLRGLALLGILTANLWSLSGYSFLTSLQRQQLPTYELDRWVYAGLRVLIDSKFSTLFSLLFGVGFALQIGRWAPSQGFGRY